MAEIANLTQKPQAPSPSASTNTAPEQHTKAEAEIKTPKREELKDLHQIQPGDLDFDLHASPEPEKNKTEIASGRLMGAISKSLKWLSHKGMIVGGGLAFIGYMLLGKFLALPGLLIAIPSAIIYFSQPSTAPKPKTDGHQEVLNKLRDLIKEPHRLEVKESAEFFEELSRQANKLSPEVKDQILEKLTELSKRFLKPPEHKDKASKEIANIVQNSLERAIVEFSPRINQG